jgi:hypothetical protein
LLSVLIEVLGRKQQRLPTNAIREIGSWLWRRPRLYSGGKENAVLAVFRYPGNEDKPDRMANHDPGLILSLTKEGQAKA